MVGAETGKKITTGAGNVLLGYAAGAELAAGTANTLVIANSSTATPMVLGVFPNTSLQFNATEMGFFKHALGKQGKVTGKKSSEVEKVLKTLLEALSGIGLVVDETT
jgi:hypothetical protein